MTALHPQPAPCGRIPGRAVWAAQALAAAVVAAAGIDTLLAVQQAVTGGLARLHPAACVRQLLGVLTAAAELIR